MRRWLGVLVATIVTATAMSVVTAAQAAPGSSRTARVAAAAATPVFGGGAGLFGTGYPSGFLGSVAQRMLDQPAAARSVTRLDLSGAVSDLPPQDQSAVALNVTVSSVTSAGYLVAYSADGTRPGTSNPNFAVGHATAVQVIVRVGVSHVVDLYNGSSASVRLTVDFAGFFRGGTYTHRATLRTVTPTRIVDTRRSFGATTPPGGGTSSVQVGGRAGVPASGVTAVLTVTATGAKSSGYLSIDNQSFSSYGTSSLNFGPGQTVANTVVVPIDADGRCATTTAAPSSS